MRRLQLATYAGGVLEALPDSAARADLLDPERWPRQELIVDLEEPGPRLQPDPVLMPRLSIRLKGRRIAAVDAVAPGGQWDAEALLDRLVEVVLEQGALPWVLPHAVGDAGVSDPRQPPAPMAESAPPRS